jgi:Ca-activated chloride channel family protein
MATAAALVAIGCFGSSEYQAPVHVFEEHGILKLCPIPDVPPASVAAKSGYTQFAVIALDESSQPIAGLKQADFQVYSESQTFPIEYLRENQGDVPVSIALLIDTSGSMVQKLLAVEIALDGLITSLKPCDELMLIAFSKRPYLLQARTTDRDIIIEKIRLLHARGQTSIYDSLDYAMQSLAFSEYTNRAIILITDGKDDASTHKDTDVIDATRQTGVAIYAIGIGDPKAGFWDSILTSALSFGLGYPQIDDRVAATILENLARAGGGRSFVVSSVKDSTSLKNSADAIGQAIGRGYSIGVDLPAGANADSVTVRLLKHPEARVFAHRITPASSPAAIPAAAPTPTPTATPAPTPVAH